MSFRIAKWARYKILFPGLALLPRRIGYRIADLIGRFDACTRPERVAVTRNMEKLLCCAGFDAAHIGEMVVRHFQMLTRDTLDCYLMPRFTCENASRLLCVHNLEALSEAKAAGKGVIIITSHFGRFFMFGPGLKFAGEEFGMLTTMIDERHPTYDHIDRWYIAKKLRNTQRFSRGTWITTGDDLRKLYRCLGNGESILIALDGTETVSKTRVSFSFFNGVLTLPEGIVRIARKTGAKLVYASCKDGHAGVEISLHSLAEEGGAALAEAVGLLEREIQKAPWHWWMWSGLTSLWRPNALNDAANSHAP